MKMTTRLMGLVTLALAAAYYFTGDSLFLVESMLAGAMCVASFATWRRHERTMARVMALMILSYFSTTGRTLVILSEGRLKRGTVYVLLDELEREGFVSSTEASVPTAPVGLSRRVYAITEAGRVEFRKQWFLMMGEAHS